MEDNERWLARHPLAPAQVTALLAARLAVRRRARLVTRVVLAARFGAVARAVVGVR